MENQQVKTQDYNCPDMGTLVHKMIEKMNLSLS